MHPKSGYLCLTVAQLSNLVVLLKSGRISLLDARVYFAGIELQERREIAKRVRSQSGDRAAKPSRFSLQELVAVIPDTTSARAKSALKRLDSAGVLCFASDRIETARAGLFPDEPLAAELTKRGALSRLVPIPRRLLAELCFETRRSVLLTKLAYIIRGLSLDRRSGELRSRGCIKASWIAEHFGLSIRSVRLARSSLIQSDFIGKDRSSFQRKLNRDGSYFEIALGRYTGTLAKENSRQSDSLETEPAHSKRDSAGTLPTPRIHPEQLAETSQNGRPSVSTRIAPQRRQNHTRIAPPRERQETPYGLKNQKPERGSFNPKASTTGVRGTEIRTVTLKDIQFEDLRRLSSLRILYAQAVAANWLSGTEAEFQNFVGAAVRATRLTQDAVRTEPVRVFVGIVKQKLWNHITSEQEERAREVISRARNRKTAGGVKLVRDTLGGLCDAIGAKGSRSANRSTDEHRTPPNASHCLRSMPAIGQTNALGTGFQGSCLPQKKPLAATTPLGLTALKSAVSAANCRRARRPAAA